LYDPVANKIIEVGPINLGAANQNTSSSDKAVPTLGPVRVAIYNGTKIAGLAGTTEKYLKAKISSVTVVSKGNAEGEYKKTLVIDLTGKQKEAAVQVAKALNGTVGSLPSGETPPATGSADLLVIVGK
jgi:hypothetical protein